MESISSAPQAVLARHNEEHNIGTPSSGGKACGDVGRQHGAAY
jgi:hypothetical protein